MKRAGEYLAAIIDADLLSKAKTYSGFFSSWAGITQSCGIAAAAGYSRIRELEKGVLVVEADHPGWVQLLQAKAQGLLTTARRRFPELDIRGISFTLSKPSGSGRAAAGVEPEEAKEAGTGEKARPEAGPASGLESGVNAGSGAGIWERIAEGEFKDSLKRLERSIRDRERSVSEKAREKKRRTP
jgi:hypothetical protein